MSAARALLPRQVPSAAAPPGNYEQTAVEQQHVLDRRNVAIDRRMRAKHAEEDFPKTGYAECTCKLLARRQRA